MAMFTGFCSFTEDQTLSDIHDCILPDFADLATMVGSLPEVKDMSHISDNLNI